MSISNLYPQIRPSLNLDFANSDRLDPRITFTRASTGTFFSSAGVLTSAAVDAPRFDYNPSTLAAQGLLIEESRTNSLLRSAEFDNASWTKTRATVTANTATAPDGTTSADSIVEDGTAANTHDLRQGAVTNSATTNWTLSFFLKAVNRTWALIELQNTSATSNRARAWFNLQTGVVGTGNTAGSGITYVSHSIQNVGNGWYRCVVVGTVDVSVTSIQAWVGGTIADSTSNYNGVNGQTSVYIWGAQLEAGAFPTSYIPTTTTELTREKDVASVNTLSPWYNATAGTIYAEATGPIASIYRVLAEGASAADFRDFSLGFDGLRGNFTSRFVTGNYDVLGPASSLTAGATVKLAGSYSSTSADLAYGGVLAVTKNSVTQRIPADRIFLGSRLGTSLQLNGHLRRLTYYPRTLSAAELASITA